MDVVAKAIRSVGISPEIERVVHNAQTIGANNNRLAQKRFDIVSPAAEANDRMLCFDVSIVSHVTNEHITRALNKPLVAATHACANKHSKYYNYTHHETEVFIPLIAETSGCLHKNFNKLYAHFGSRVNDEPPLQANWSAQTFTQYWLQRTSVVVWRETARSLMRLARASIRKLGIMQPYDLVDVTTGTPSRADEDEQ